MTAGTLYPAVGVRVAFVDRKGVVREARIIHISAAGRISLSATRKIKSAASGPFFCLDDGRLVPPAIQITTALFALDDPDHLQVLPEEKR